VRYVIVLLAILGIVVSSLALKVHYDDAGKEPCSINDKWDCGVVNHSPYAVIHGVPVATIGIIGYVLIAVLYLTNIEAHVLEVYCLYCVISQGIIALLALLSIGWVVWSIRQRRTA